MSGKKMLGQDQAKKIASVLTLIFLSCLFSGLIVKREIEVFLEEKKIETLSGSGLILNFLFRIVNSSSFEYQLIKTETRTLINQQEFFRLATALEEPISVPPRSSVLINLPVKITYVYLFQALPELKETEKLTCNLIGWLTLADYRRREQKIPLTATADFPYFKDWAVILESLEVKNLSLGGADLVLNLLLTNNNSSAWIFRSLEGHIELAGKKVSTFSQSFQDSLGAGEGKKLSVSLLLDFFELGSDLQEALAASQIEASFTGQIVIENEWGQFQLPISTRSRLKILRNP
ncbi:MAG: hypothetical protein N3B16_02280 [Candidatus Aminicenantes bacterium]|nr:hypothetical protein [Candidatus Aminicenantes bacterium]